MRYVAIVAFMLCGCGDPASPPAADGGAARDASPTPADAGPPPSWRLAGTAPQGAAHYREAVRLGTGDILVIGGASEGTLDYSIQLFAPSTQTWRHVGDIPVVTLGNHAVVVLRDGSALATSGGTSTRRWLPEGVPNSFALRFDPTTSAATARARPLAPRMFVRGLLLDDGQVLLVGGASEMPTGTIVALASAESYDPGVNVWSPAGAMTDARWSHSATLLPSGEVLVAGGTDERGRFLATAELYDPTSRSWRATGSMHEGRAWHAAVRLGSGRVLVAGGQIAADMATASAEIYDPTTGAWQDAAPLPRVAMDMGAAALPDGNALVAGGWDAAAMQVRGAALVYDEPAAAWRGAGMLNEPRAAHSLVIAADGRAVVLMGVTGPARATASAEITDGPVL